GERPARRARGSRERGRPELLVAEHSQISGDGLASTGVLQCGARSAERVPPGLALQMQAVEPGIRHARLLGGCPTRNGASAVSCNSIRQRQSSVNTPLTEM